MEIKVFGLWGVDGIKVTDQGLIRYLNLDPRLVPKSGARYAGARFHKSDLFILERLANKVFVTGHKGHKHLISSGHNAGKKEKILGMLKKSLKIIETKLKKNPVEVLVGAIEAAAPREETISIEYGGAKYPKAVDVAPQRRVDLALRWITQGAYSKSFSKKNTFEEALADEIINTYQASSKSTAVSKKRDVERQAASSK